MSVKFRELLYEKSVKGKETLKAQYDEKDVTIFDFLSQIWSKKEKHKYDKKIASGFMLTNWISNDRELIYHALHVCKHFYSMTDEQIYKYFFYSIPKTRKRYISWQRKDAVSLKREKQIEKIMDDFEVSKNEAMMILKHKERINNGNKI